MQEIIAIKYFPFTSNGDTDLSYPLALRILENFLSTIKSPWVSI